MLRSRKIMTLKNIECRLYAPPETLRYLWNLMAEKNTPLINQLLLSTSQHPEFEQWFQQKQLPQKELKNLCNQLKTQQPYQNQPGRFYSSAIALTSEIYKSWFAIQKKLNQRIEGKQRWLNLLKSDSELEQECGQTLEQICLKATDILNQFDKISSNNKKIKQQKSSSKSDKTLFNHLFDTYQETTDTFSSCALAYLLKNNCQIPEQEEDTDKFLLRKHKKELEIQRLQTQLHNRLPKQRDLTGEQWLDILNTVNNYLPQDESMAALWQSNLLRKSPVIPFPVDYGSSTDLTWSKAQRGHLQVKFNGLGKYQFEIRCDKRHLCWFQRFFEDYTIKKHNQEQYSAALFTLRSACLLWREGKGKGHPWAIHKLYLQCCVDTLYWTVEGSQEIAQEKSITAQKKLDHLKQKTELTPQQQAYQQRQQSVIAKINTPYPRPHKPPYQGNPDIIMGVSLGLKVPATIAIVNAVTHQVLTYRTTKQLLGKNDKLLNRQRQHKQRLTHLRHQAQKQARDNKFGESHLGQYVDRLIAKAIADIAQNYRVSSIVIPQMQHIREIIHSELQAKAERESPGYKEGQKQYAKQYRINVNQWSYGRLIESIEQAASKIGINIEKATQSRQGTPQEKAKNLAFCAYKSRLKKVI